MARLFYDTVHSVNAKDYSSEQLNAWATGIIDKDAWCHSFVEHYTMVAVADKKIVGFGDIDSTGYLDRLFVHKDYQGRGVASALCCELENHAMENGVSVLSTHSSITAKHFFERRGYIVRKEQQVERKGIKLTNFVMEKLC
jgi:putative acetyltransferase